MKKTKPEAADRTDTERIKHAKGPGDNDTLHENEKLLANRSP
jgi:hypothetical protein